MAKADEARSSEEVTALLQAWSGGDRSAFDKLAHIVYAELRRLALNYMSRERRDRTLQPTALVHEAYLRLADLQSMPRQPGPLLRYVRPGDAARSGRLFPGYSGDGGQADNAQLCSDSGQFRPPLDLPSVVRVDVAIPYAREVRNSDAPGGSAPR